MKQRNKNVNKCKEYFYIRDITGNITNIIDSNGTIKVSYEYDAWGKVINVDVDEDLIEINSYLYKGYYYDKETSLYYCNSRYYDPKLRRWISIDDINYLDIETINGVNLYAYCMNNPIMCFDPSGHMPKWLKWTLGGLAIAGLVVATVLTCGVAGTGAVAVGAAMLIGGTVSGGMNLIDQIHDGGTFDWTELAISTLSGTAYGLIVGLTGGAGTGAIVGKFAIAGGTSLLDSWNQNASIGETIASFCTSLVISGIVQGAGYLAGKYGPHILSKIMPRNPNHLITMGDICSALWNIPAVKTGITKLVSGVISAISNDFQENLKMLEFIKYCLICLCKFISAAFGNNPKGMTIKTIIVGGITLYVLVGIYLGSLQLLVIIVNKFRKKSKKQYSNIKITI